jgi:hypothetical protein
MNNAVACCEEVDFSFFELKVLPREYYSQAKIHSKFQDSREHAAILYATQSL